MKPFLLPICFSILPAITGCSDALSRNRDRIEEIEIEKQVQAGHNLTSIAIVNHLDSGSSLTVMLKGILDSTRPFTDTLRFAVTADGLIIQ